MIAMVTSINAQINRSPPSLNGPNVDQWHRANSVVRTVAKWDGHNFYIFAGSTENGGPFQANFAIPCVGSGATATVLGESRSTR